MITEHTLDLTIMVRILQVSHSIFTPHSYLHYKLLFTVVGAEEWNKYCPQISSITDLYILKNYRIISCWTLLLTGSLSLITLTVFESVLTGILLIAALETFLWVFSMKFIRAFIFIYRCFGFHIIHYCLQTYKTVWLSSSTVFKAWDVLTVFSFSKSRYFTDNNFFCTVYNCSPQSRSSMRASGRNALNSQWVDSLDIV